MPRFRVVTAVLATLASIAAAQTEYGYCTHDRQRGECLPTSQCSDLSGNSTAGLCESGGSDVQCCTYGSCYNRIGRAGTCVPVGACSNSGGESDPGGFCPGGADIQCCTYGTCKIPNGRAGSCQPTDSCITGKVVSGDLCPGNSKIQCCDFPKTPKPDPTPTCGPPPVNERTLRLLKGSEACVPTPYADPGVGYTTIGYGHLCGDDECSEVDFPIPLSPRDCNRLLQFDLVQYETCVADALTRNVTMNDNQYGALVDFIYNLGCGITSDFFGRFNAGEDKIKVAEEELPKYKYAGGVVLPGLVVRRRKEVRQFKAPSDIKALPYKRCESPAN